MKQQPTISYLRIREYAERWMWTDPKTGRKREGYDAPQDAPDRERKPYYVKALTEGGKLIEGECITLRVNTSLHSREVKFINSGEIRQISDLFIIEIDGVRFNVH